MTPGDLLAKHGIHLESTAPGRYYTPCPRCSMGRNKPGHKNAECLGVTVKNDTAHWGCNHCGWAGPEKGAGAKNGKGQGFTATYDYVDASGKVLFQKVRNPPGHEPRFWCRRPDDCGGWIKGLKDVDYRPLYREPEVIEAIGNGHEVAVVEGEKDADRLWSIGLPATCNFDGAADATKSPKVKPKWKAEYSERLRGAHLVIFNDNDPQGYAHADAVCRMSVDTAARVRRLDLALHWPDMPKGADISDWLDRGHTRKQLDLLIAAAPDYVNDKSAGHEAAVDGIAVISAKDLNMMHFEPIKYVVPGVIVEGLTLLAGKPKIGKSWLLMHAAIAVARGGFTLGDIKCAEGDVLYCALEDNLRRLQSRITKLLGTQEWPARLFFRCEMPRLAEGGLDWIRSWIKSANHPRLIIIDTLAMVRAAKKRDESSYDSDYSAVKELRALANEYGIAIVLVHHLRKADADDAFDTVSGTLGLTGAPDTILVLKYDAAGVVLHGRGRDLVEIEKAMTFSKDTCVWTLTGDAAEMRRSNERGAILAALDEAGEALGPSQIAEAASMRPVNVRALVCKLLKEGVIEKAGYGKYQRRETPPTVPEDEESMEEV